MTATRAGVQAFKEAYVSTGTPNSNTFELFEARLLRYELNWALYENNCYRSLNSWATKLKTDYGLYRYIRGIYNPAYRIGDFWQSHLWGGALDPKAGDGKQTPSALPILIPDSNASADKLRVALATLWLASNWQINKDLVSLRGSVLGDEGIRIVDDPERKKVYLQPVHAATIANLTTDSFGNVKAYVIEEKRVDPRQTNPQILVTYSEECTREGDNVIWRTYLDGNPYGWQSDSDGMPIDEWSEPYGFVPLVFIKHNDVGKRFGWSELHSDISKFFEVDDLASKLHDYVRKAVDAPMILAGISKPTTTPKVTHTTATDDNPQPGREEIPTFYGPVGASAVPAIAPLDIAATSAEIKEMIAELERDHPELRDDLQNATGEISGRALRVNRQRVETIGQKRRPNYDNALVRAQQMAIAMGGFRGYEGYTGFGLDSYANHQLDHAIANRPIFAPDPLDELEQKEKVWSIVSNTVAQTNGEISAEMVLRDLGWTDEQIAASGIAQRTQEDVIPTVTQ